jgi:hypothetical protein
MPFAQRCAEGVAGHEAPERVAFDLKPEKAA